jgi:hypothetical protein
MQKHLGVVTLFLLCGAFLPQFTMDESRRAAGARSGAADTRTSVFPSAAALTGALTATNVLSGTILPATYLPIARADKSVQPPVPSFSHIFIILLENKEYDDMIGNPSAPYFNSLAQQYGVAANSYGVTHPSLPNYIALTSGDTYSITTNCDDCFLDVPNIADQIESAGKTWKAYMGAMPQPCFVGNKGSLYAQKHNPFIYYDNIRTNPARCGRIVPFTEFATDLQNEALANYTWITPNMCDSQHDCSVAKGDVWLQTWVPQILASLAWQQDGVLFITYDEGSTDAGCCGGSAGGRIPTLVISPLGKPAFQSNIAYDHYSLLLTIERAWNMPPLGKAANAAAMSDFFR